MTFTCEWITGRAQLEPLHRSRLYHQMAVGLMSRPRDLRSNSEGFSGMGREGETPVTRKLQEFSPAGVKLT